MKNGASSRQFDLAAMARRVRALVRKETYQVLRDPSSLAIGVVMPVLLILLFGYGLSLDVKNVKLALVLEDSGAEGRELAARFELSPYFKPTFTTSMAAGLNLIVADDVDAVLRIPQDFSRRVLNNSASVQLLVVGSDANRARAIQGYVQGAIALWESRRVASVGEPAGSSLGPVRIINRQWFNESNDSRYFLVPGLIVLVMTLIGAFLTAMVIAREWERGTFEALFVTPVRAPEILLSKIIPYFGLGFAGFVLCILAARILFHVPLRGSPFVLCGASMLYLLVSLGIGLLISSVVKSQFVASQLALLVTFLPATMLSGFIFDIRSMPPFVQAVTYLVPARYFVSLLQTIFLAGNVWAVILPNLGVLLIMALLLLFLALRATKKKLA